MDILTALMLGSLQGLTEFLPVSSSGHLVLAEALLPGEALSSPGILFEVVVHLGTLAAAMIWLRREFVLVVRSLGPSGSADGRRFLLLLLVASVPAAATGFALAGAIRTAFGEVGFAGMGLLLTGALLLVAGKKDPGGTSAPGLPRLSRGIPDALLIGAAQAIAILPGVSRSGITIVTGRLAGLGAGDAARFSFLLSAPVILGAAALEALHAAGSAAWEPALAELAVGFVSAFGFGLIALRWVFVALTRKRFHAFGWYCLAAGGIGVGLAIG